MALVNATLPSSYEYYTSGGINAGLSANQSYFTLNNRNVTLYSGSLHYFRVPKQYWRDRLRKMRAAGLNAIETYIPWNLHEPESGYYDFGSGGSEMQDLLDVEAFLKTAQEEDLFAIVRPGPYICSEWEFGGFPSWLLREQDIQFRTSDPTYMRYVTRYFNVLLTLLTVLQFTNGGPIVAFQVENEYGSTQRRGKFTPDRLYLRELRQLMLGNGIRELLLTSDSPTMSKASGTLPKYFLQTANFADDPESEFDALNRLQANKPTMAMEFWSGWFDHWSEKHHTRELADFEDVLERILKYPASVNMYMFHGGTNFGFMNGANVENELLDNSGYQPDVTSYDYDAPLSENGDYTVKYAVVKELIKKYNKVHTRLPLTPAITPRIKYPNVKVEGQLLLDDLVKQLGLEFHMKCVVPMEVLPINNLNGQSYGYILYRTTNLTLPAKSVLTIPGHVTDTIIVILNGNRLNKPLTTLADLDGFGYYRKPNSSIILNSEKLTGATLELLVENWGRVNFASLDQYYQFKGLRKNVLINNIEIFDWVIFPLEFKKRFIAALVGWQPVVNNGTFVPALYKASFTIDDIKDTWIDMQDWYKGIVVINGFVLGRYARIGPQQTLYLPAPFLLNGTNTILIFEHFDAATNVKFSSNPIYKTV